MGDLYEKSQKSTESGTTLYFHSRANDVLDIEDMYTPQPVGEVEVAIIEDNVVITVRRVDEARFGPASLVVV